ncbi:hypothetical protein H6S82_08865 [Planktothrix sp. FACHB-1355]|uniref:Uncharacterized protein n=1 Tax=Aerosakkonema funiforme FACHB-1375 TaxID=2949571 RepID=A0A926VCU2_9CYAN|nr:MULTISPECIES: hypothetical protein [Oscillatoriales]MBD2181023.1 hypothetical protein [Aerosakkonema funiforme FACHB-1375]MBD3558968.1 hypothetical protein [Planktothrix sp. FACHB-1355]
MSVFSLFEIAVSYQPSAVTLLTALIADSLLIMMPHGSSVETIHILLP